jgi:hypothetical protein
MYLSLSQSNHIEQLPMKLKKEGWEVIKILLLLSDLVSPNVFTFSGAYCIGKDSAYEPSTKILIFVIFHLMVWRRVSN